jgi:hypothetical protein
LPRKSGCTASRKMNAAQPSETVNTVPIIRPSKVVATKIEPGSFSILRARRSRLSRSGSTSFALSRISAMAG